jgi:sugar fermentation stimulation protein A
MDCEVFSLADDIDPAYGLAFRDARARGVETFCYDCDISLEGIVLRKSLPLSIL